MEESAIKAGADGPVSLADCKDLVKRKLLTKVVTTSFNLTKGSRFTLDVKKHITGKLRLPANRSLFFFLVGLVGLGLLAGPRAS